ncbi:MAG: T9SS type A sorting domain-containing protein, partial [bacterium]
MRKVYFVILFACLSVVTFGQTFIWEGFDSGQMPPTGWTLNGYAAQWSISNTANAGGTPPEAMFTYISATGVSRFISPAIDLTGLTSVQFSFKHYYDDYTGAGPKVGVATRSGGGAWAIVWEINPTTNVGPEQIDLVISNSNVGATDFQFCFYVDGNMYNIDYWYLDNILLFNPLNLDGAITMISTPSFIGGPTPVEGTVMNMGLTTITGLQIDWQLNNGPIHSTTFTGLSLQTLDTYNFDCTDQVNASIGTHILTVWIKLVNGIVDDDQNNDTLRKVIKKACNIIPRKPCFEEFTSSTCAPCAAFNANFVPWCQQHDDQITLVKYQMNWPGAGDPYYTAEGGVRRNYYGVSWVPWLVCNGSFTETTMGAVQTAFDLALLQPGLVDLVASHNLSGTNMNVNATTLPFVDFTNAVLHIIVFEYITTGNVGTNGETEFHHVMMKMMPDANGTTTNLSDRQPFTVDETVDLSGTNVEEWDDLGVLVLVQDLATAEIYQSIYSVENGVFGTEARLDDILIDGTSLPGFDPDVFTYDVEVPGGVLIPQVTGLPMDPNATVIVVDATTIPGTTTIDVFAEDLTTHNVYNVNWIFAVGQDEVKQDAIRAYPNPTNSFVYIQGALHARVAVYTAAGIEVKSIEDFTGNSINLSDLSEGVYMLSVQTQKGNLIQKKIALI